MLNRRQLLIMAGAGAAATSLAACAQDPPGTGDQGEGGEAGLRLYWWGADIRGRLTEEAVEVFGEQHPDLAVDLEWGEWGTYWDRLATNAAAGDMPDVVQMDEAYIDAYGVRGSLLDLESVESLDLSGMDPSVLDTGRVSDGTLVGAPIGVAILSVGVNPTILEQADVQMPDDTRWTWESFGELSAEISEALADEDIYGFDFFGQSNADLGLWARQLGEYLFPQEGEQPLTAGTVAEYLEYAQWLMEIGAVPTLSEQIEDFDAGVDQSRFATNRCAFHFQFHTQVQAFAAGSGEALGLLRAPAHSPGEHHMVNKASMYWSIAESSAHPEEAGTLVDFLLTDPDAARILGVERGVTAIPEAQEAIEPDLDEMGTIALEFAQVMQDEVVPPPMVTPSEGVEFADEFRRLAGEALFEQASIADVADQVITSLESMQPQG